MPGVCITTVKIEAEDNGSDLIGHRPFAAVCRVMVEEGTTRVDVTMHTAAARERSRTPPRSESSSARRSVGPLAPVKGKGNRKDGKGNRKDGKGSPE